MRIRTLKPEFWTNEKLSRLPECVHLFAAAILNYADDEGFFNANIGLIKGALFPLREPSVSIQCMLTELSNIDYLRVSSGTDGRVYGFVVNFLEHQRINRPTVSKIKHLADFTEPSVSPHCILTAGTGIREQGSGNRDQGTGNKANSRLEYSKEFLEFWKNYPERGGKKVGKKNAYAEWKKTKSYRPEQEKLIQILSMHIANWKNDGFRFVPDAERWIKRHGWDDEISTIVPSSPRDQSHRDFHDWAMEKESGRNDTISDSEVFFGDHRVLPGKICSESSDDGNLV